MAALIIAIFPQNSSRGNWEEQQDRTDPNSRFELARKPAWLLAFRQFGLPKWKHDFECSSLSANQRFQHIYDLAILNVGGVGKLLAVLLPHGFEFSAALDVVQNGRYIRNLTSCAAMGCGGT